MPVRVFRGKRRVLNIYGPTAGSESVRVGATPQAVTVFPGTAGVDFTQLNPASSQATNQAAITADTTGKVWFPKGTYNVTGSAYTFKTATEYRWESVAGYTRSASDTAVMNGPGNAAGSFDAASFTAGSTFKGGKWQNFTSGINLATGSVIEDVEVTAMFNVGMGMAGTTRATRCYIHSNGNYNLTAAGSGPPGGANFISNVTIQNCRLADGNTRLNDFGNDAGCTKFLFVHGMTIDHNWIESNFGSGLWWDTDCVNIMCEENVLENNRWSGCFYEDSGGGTVFQHNAYLNNGDPLSLDGSNANFQLASADGITFPGSNGIILIEFNLVDGDGTQTSLWLHNSHDPHLCRGVHIQDNDIWLRTSGTARAGGSNAGGQFAGKDLTWLRNIYHVDSLSTSKWHWDTTQFLGTKTWAQWQALGFDVAGTRLVI